MYAVVSEHVFPFLRKLGGDDSTCAHHMKDARFTIPTPGLLAKVVDLIDDVPMEERDTKGDLLFNRTNSIDLVGKTGIVRDGTPMAYAGYLIRLRVNAANVSDYVWGSLIVAMRSGSSRGCAKA